MRQEQQAMGELPKYKSHKTVWALKISAVNPDNEIAELEGRAGTGGAWIVPEESGYAHFHVDADYVAKHKPVVGGYYVVYSDGYKSFSPAKAFEDGYTRI